MDSNSETKFVQHNWRDFKKTPAGGNATLTEQKNSMCDDRF